jgi:hypothetical protein
MRLKGSRLKKYKNKTKITKINENVMMIRNKENNKSKWKNRAVFARDGLFIGHGRRERKKLRRDFPPCVHYFATFVFPQSGLPDKTAMTLRSLRAHAAEQINLFVACSSISCKSYRWFFEYFRAYDARVKTKIKYLLFFRKKIKIFFFVLNYLFFF